MLSLYRRDNCEDIVVVVVKLLCDVWECGGLLSVGSRVGDGGEECGM